MKKLSALIVISLFFVACGPSAEEIRSLTDERIGAILSQTPTPTPIIFPPTPTPIPPELLNTPTPQPTATPQPTPTPQPTATPSAVVDFNAIWSQFVSSVFWIETYSGLGTGWLLEPGWIVTNHHVVGYQTSVTIRQMGDPAFTGTVVAYDSIGDIALIRYSTDPNPVSGYAIPLDPVATGSLTVTDTGIPLMAMGYSGNIGIQPNGTVGAVPINIGSMVGTLYNSETGVTEIVMDAPVDPGDSGGPVLNGRGKVVGMVRAASGTSSGRHIGTNYSVHIDRIMEVIPQLKLGYNY